MADGPWPGLKKQGTARGRRLPGGAGGEPGGRPTALCEDRGDPAEVARTAGLAQRLLGTCVQGAHQGVEVGGLGVLVGEYGEPAHFVTEAVHVGLGGPPGETHLAGLLDTDAPGLAHGGTGDHDEGGGHDGHQQHHAEIVHRLIVHT